jgi:acetyl-CoA acyltransferase
MRDAVIVEAVRTPIGRRRGSLAGTHPVDLAAHLLEAIVERTGIDPVTIDDVVFGCVNQLADQAGNVGRLSVLAAGWPESIPGTTIDRACGSSQQALHFAAAGVIAGQYDIVIAGGVESMSRVPLGSARSMGEPYGPSILKRYGTVSFNQGLGAEIIADRWNFSREELDAFSLQSHRLAAAAIDSGVFESQIVPVEIEGGVLGADEAVRRETTMEKLAALKPAFKDDGVITAGNSSQIADGAGAMLVMTSEKAAELGLRPLARYHAGSVAGDDPITMLLGVIPATEKVLARADLTIDDIGVYEVNEAFAPVPMAWLDAVKGDPARLNPMGGAIAVGHPLGASGAILMTRLVHWMQANDIRYGLQVMCEAGGMANATVLERL